MQRKSFIKLLLLVSVMVLSCGLATAQTNLRFSEWSGPVNLGSPVNTSASVEGRASLSFDGTELYFMSNRPGSFGDQDIYVVSRRRGIGEAWLPVTSPISNFSKFNKGEGDQAFRLSLQNK
jgi:hypothetical protein